MEKEGNAAGTPDDPACPRCGGALVETAVRSAIWQGSRLSVVEDIPARVCARCLEQYFDDDVSDALRVLNERGFPSSEAREIIEVPVFSLQGRIRTRRNRPDEDFHVD